MKAYLIGIIVSITAALCALADEPAELVKLRQQFHDRLNKEMQPWLARYVGELEKLEKMLASSGRLEEALVVKQERLKSATVDAAPEKKETANPRQAAELQKKMEGTYWIVFDPQDEKRENMRDVYEFRANGIFVNLLHAKKQHKWVASAASRIKVDHELGTFDIKVDWNSAKGEVGYSYQEQVNLLVLVNRPASK
jgi:hypothetical protein